MNLLNLDYTGMTPEQIEDFTNSTSISFEVDAMITINPALDGQLVEGNAEASGATGWLSGQVLNVDINDNYDVSAPDMITYALQAFKEANYNMDEAFKLLAKQVEGLGQHVGEES